jgi:hypothetical protein
MTRARDLADSGAIINELDNISSDVQAQIDAADAAAAAAQAAVNDTAVAMAIALGG